MFESTLEVLTVSVCGVFNFYKDDFIHQVFDCSAGQVVSDDVLCICSSHPMAEFKNPSGSIQNPSVFVRNKIIVKGGIIT